jgi:hypothetical protein
MSVGTLPDGSDEYSIPEEPDELVVEIKARANRLPELKRLFALRRIVTGIAESDPKGLLNTEIALADVRPPTIVVRMWWKNLETLETALESDSSEWIWKGFYDGTWGTAFKWHVYTIGKPTASPRSPPKDHEWMQETWRDTPATEKEHSRLWTVLTEPNVLALSPLQWIGTLSIAFAWSLFAPEMLGPALGPTARGAMIFGGICYIFIRVMNERRQLRDQSTTPALDGVVDE